MKSVHPYEEPAFDIYPLKNSNVNYGAGAIGTLSGKLTAKEFLSRVSELLGAEFLKYTNGNSKKIERVAVCGGTCADMFNTAIAKGADAFITADVKYHTFQDAENRIMLIDAGHFETEVHVLTKVKSYIEHFAKNNNLKIKVYKYSGSTNPVKFFNKKE
jgi:putative NIF3 family GTP cyclohydrolase 1 type 2